MVIHNRLDRCHTHKHRIAFYMLRKVIANTKLVNTESFLLGEI